MIFNNYIQQPLLILLLNYIINYFIFYIFNLFYFSLDWFIYKARYVFTKQRISKFSILDISIFSKNLAQQNAFYRSPGTIRFLL